MRHLIRLIGVLAVLCAACGGAVGGDLPPVPPSATAPPSAVKITPSDNMGTVSARVGDTIQVALGEQYNWTVDPPGGVVLVRDGRALLLVRGTQALFKAAAPGRASVTATGVAACPTGAACPMFAVLFKTTVIVEP